MFTRMRNRSVLFIAVRCSLVGLAWAIFTPPGLAQVAAPLEQPELTQSGQAYERSVRFSSIDTEVIYFDPGAAPPDLEADVEPPEETGAEAPTSGETIPPVFGWLAAIILAAMIFLFVRFGGGISLSLRSAAENSATLQRTGMADAEAPERLPASFDAILNMPDRRAAIVELARRVLADVMTREGTLQQKSWTARDALRRVKLPTEDMQPLRSLVLASERVQFGDRTISEDEFQRHLGAIQPLISRAAA